MTSVFLQATGIGVEQGARNWAATIVDQVDFVNHARRATLTPRQTNALRTAHPNGRAPFWGTHEYYAAAGRSLAPGDVVFFTGGARIQAIARVGVALDNAAFADTLWPRHRRRGSYRYVYSLSAIDFVDLPYGEFAARGAPLRFSARGLHEIVGRDADALRRAFATEIRALRGAARSLTVPATPDVSSGTPRRGIELELSDPEETRGAQVPPAAPARTDPADDDWEPGPGEVDVAAHLDGFDGPTDAEVVVRARREQAQLRRLLLGRDAREGRCGLCGRVLPVGVLVAAHIKRRSACAEEERKDLANVAMLACVLGCDALFEAGYITVGPQGRIVTAPASLAHPTLRQVLRAMSGHHAPGWTADKDVYFSWHRTHRFLGASVRA